jgi:phage-related protein
VQVADAVLIFRAFAKKTRKTPDREIELGKKRLKEML